ncbi:MAG: glycoside hydrolase family 3 C-terminal domain-containing protein [Eubacteriales bacterium]
MKYENNVFKGYELGSLAKAPIPELEKMSKKAASEGIVLLKNEKNVLPLEKGETVSVFGRIQRDYYKSGTGSGGLVNVRYKSNILDSLRKNRNVKVNEELASIYEAWEKEHPFDNGKGWAQEPWCQEEMELDDKLVRDASKKSDKAIIVIGRTAGEDKDNSATEGSYLLSAKEEEMIKKVCSAFRKVCVVLNVGNVIDMKWVEKYNVGAVLYVWQGGMCGGDAAADVLTGKVTPCGKLADTIAYSIDDYPSTANFGDAERNVYKEDIYVGYRYFETFAKDKVMYPFGYGLSYTKFAKPVHVSAKKSTINVEATVKNTGKYSGKEVIQVYFEAPQGTLGNPSRRLIGFAKTKLLKPGASDILKINFRISDMASYDDSGASGHKSCYVLEAGDYNIYVGTDARSAEKAFTYTVKATTVTRKCRECLAPVIPFDRIKPDKDMKLSYGQAPQRTYALKDRIEAEIPSEIAFTGDRGIKLGDVRNGKSTMDEFIAQLNDEELACIVRGEGMNSPKVTAGTGCCFGGVTDELLSHGIPIACGTDGPSGIRMDSGMLATSMPNGTCLACTFDKKLVGRLYEYEGIEMTAYNIDVILGPGLNIHRNPLNGRNFEYFSEDPYLTGEMAAVISSALNKSGVYCTIKHFMANSQEFHRHDSDSVLSERAVREIYAYPFERAIKTGGKMAVMTSYNLVNGDHAATCYDLTTSLLRNEWGFDGFVMTDWWPLTNSLDGTVSRNDTASMVKAQNDIFMVVADAKTYADTVKDALASGYLKRAELQRCAKNICRFIMNTHSFERYRENGFKAESSVADVSGMKKVFEIENLNQDQHFTVKAENSGNCVVEIEVSSNENHLAQIITNLFISGQGACAFVTHGTSGGTEKAKAEIYLTAEKDLDMYFHSSSVTLKLPKVTLYV